MHFGANYQGTAETAVYSTPSAQMQARLLLDASWTHHDKDGKWSVTPWVSNITDKVYRVAALPVAGLWNFTNYGPPRSFDVTANLSSAWPGSPLLKVFPRRLLRSVG